MKRCPKCSRTFPDDNQKFCTIDGGLLVADQPFDPNATFRSSAPLNPPSAPPPATPPPAADKPAGAAPPDFGATIATSSSAPTAVLPKNTGPTGARTIVDHPAPAAKPPSAPLPQRPSAPVATDTPSIPIPPPVAKKKSKLPLIIGILLVLLVLGVGAVAAVFFLVIKPRLNEVRPAVATAPTKEENTNSNTSVAVEQPKKEPDFVAPPNTVKFENSNTALDGKLAEHYFDFSFYYPSEWTVVPKTPSGASFIKVERRLPPDFTQENFAVGWYDNSKGTFAADEAGFPQRVADLSNRLAKTLPEYRKVSEGPTKVNSLDAYEFRFVSLSKGTEKGDLQLWGRVIFLPRGEGETTGAILSMLTTSLAPELSGVDDVGEKGELPVVLESFRFGKKS
ncbi:MAG TPA: hypothetical protein VHR36_12340 [Pyrinomonadaceae bacterium]|nr:hypothetical protein [Pyrinomonadaceae bacterium]